MLSKHIQFSRYAGNFSHKYLGWQPKKKENTKKQLKRRLSNNAKQRDGDGDGDGDGSCSCSCICGQCSDRHSRQLLTACHIFAPFPLICRTHLVAAAGGGTTRLLLLLLLQHKGSQLMQALTCVRLLPQENICASFELLLLSLLLLVLFSVLHFDLLPRQSFSIFAVALKRKMQQQKCSCRRKEMERERERGKKIRQTRNHFRRYALKHLYSRKWKCQ